MKTILGCTLAVALATVAFAKTETPKLTRAQAQKIALAKAPGITEILVNANDGSIVAVQHETPAKEAAEQAKEKKEKKH